MKKRILVIGSQWINKQFKPFAYHEEKLFQLELRSQGSRNMVKVQCCTFQQCFGPFTMLLVKSSPETGLFRHLSNHVFWSPYIQKYISNEGHFFRKISRFDLNLENARKNSKNIFRFWDNCIWKCCYKVPLLRTEYLLFAANGLKKSPKILHIFQRHIFNLN